MNKSVSGNAKGGGLPKSQAFDKPGSVGRIPNNNAKAPQKGSSGGSGGGNSAKGAAAALRKQSTAAGCR